MGLGVGIAVCFSSSALSNLGLILVKSVVTAQEHEILVDTPRSGAGDSPRSEASEDGLTRRRKLSFFDDMAMTQRTSIKVLSKANLTWLIGLLLFVLGQVLNLVALSYLEEVVWAVLSLFSLVTNAVFSSLILHEPFRAADLVSTALILVGSGMVVVANDAALQASAQDAAWTVPEFVSHFTRAPFLAYCGVLAAILAGTVLHGVRAVGRGHTVHALTWTVFSATSGSVSVLLGKCIAELVSLVASTPQGLGSPEAERLFSSVSTYLIVAVFVAAALGALVSLNMALAVGEALLVVPWLTVVNTLLAILGGVFYFEEYDSLRSPMRALLFVAGVLLAMAGSVLLQRGRVTAARRLSIDHSDLYNARVRAGKEGDEEKEEAAQLLLPLHGRSSNGIGNGAAVTSYGGVPSSGS